MRIQETTRWETTSRRLLLSAMAFAMAAFAVPAHATYSIVATDPMTGQCGVAVQTDNLAVGASVPTVQAGVGAVASQFETNPRHGPLALALLTQGKSPDEILQKLLEEDGNFEGNGPAFRQFAIVSVDGRTAVHTGAEAARAEWAGSRRGQNYSVQGNGLAGPHVLEAMERAFLTATGPLAERLLVALGAGDRAGGQRTGRESAALLVRTREGFPLDVDLRVDHADDPVGQLGFIHGLQSARQVLIQARLAGQRGDIDAAKLLFLSAVDRVKTWPRGCILAAQVATEIEQPALAIQYLAYAFERSPVWISKVIGEGTFASLGGDQAFHRWITSDLEKDTLADYQKVTASKKPFTDEDLTLVRRLLEIGRATESLDLLAQAPVPSPEVILLRSSALAAQGNLDAAIQQCRDGLEINSDDARLKVRLSRFKLGN